MTPEELNKLLANTRDQKFRKKTEKQIHAIALREAGGWKEKNEDRLKNPEFLEKRNQAIQNAYKSDELRKNQSVKAKGRKMTDEQKANLVKIRLSAPPRDKETCKKIGQAQIGNKKRCKPIHTPIGQFDSLKEAAAEYEKRGRGNAVKHLTKWLKIDSDNFYYINK